MSEQTRPDEDITQEFRNLGLNLAEVLRAAWEHPERKRMQEEITIGLNEMGNTLRHEVESFNESQAAQQLKADVKEFGERVRSQEISSKVRQELISALQIANAELQRVIQRWSAAQPDERAGDASGEAQNDPELTEEG